LIEQQINNYVRILYCVTDGATLRRKPYAFYIQPLCLFEASLWVTSSEFLNEVQFWKKTEQRRNSVQRSYRRIFYTEL